MTIVITMTIQVEAGDLLLLGDRLLEQLLRLNAQPAPVPPITPTAPSMPPRTLKPRSTVLRPAKRPALRQAQPPVGEWGPSGDEPTAQNGLEGTRTDEREGKTPADGAAPEIAAIPPATPKADEEQAPPKKMVTGDRLPFEPFDKLVRKEVKRLGMDGRIPSARLWDSERDKRLPTYGAVMYRYNTRNLAEFAAQMGMEPPLSAKKFTVNENGANATYGQAEEQHDLAA